LFVCLFVCLFICSFVSAVYFKKMNTGRDPIQISAVNTMQYFFVNLFCSLMSATVHNAMQFLSNFTFWHFHFMHYAFTFLGMLILALGGRVPRQVLPWRQMLPIALSRLFSSIGINTVANGHLEGGLFILRGFDCCITGFVLLVCNRMLGSRLKRTRHRYYIVIPIAILSSLSWFYPTYWYGHFRWILFIPMAVIAGGFHNILSYNQYQKLGVPFSVFLMNISAYSAALLFIPIVVNKIFCFDCALESENDEMEFQLADYALLFGGMAAMFGLIFTQYMLMCHCNPIDYSVFRHFKYTLAAVGQQVTQNLMHYNFVNIFAQFSALCGSVWLMYRHVHTITFNVKCSKMFITFCCFCYSGSKAVMDSIERLRARYSWFKHVSHPVPINVKMRRDTASKLANKHHFVAATEKDRYKILESRDITLRAGIIKDNNAREAKKTVGFCLEMCPEKERYRRFFQSGVPIYEMWKFWHDDDDDRIDHVHMVKEYVRSSADQPEPLPHELRPPYILSLTMDHLIQNIVVKEPHVRKHLSSWYYFLTNRMHAIRKDITQQMLCDTTTAFVLEKCVRFYIYTTFRLRALPISMFDQQLNLNELGHCLASLLVMYQDLKKSGETSPNKAEFFVYNMIYRMIDADMLGLVWRYDENLFHNPRVSFILQLHKYFQQGNFVKFFKAYKESATFLEACLLSRYVMEFRIASVNAIRQAYKIHKTTVKISSITDWLCFDNDRETQAFLAQFRIMPYPDQPDMVDFNPKDFRHKPESFRTWSPRLNFVNTKMTQSLVEIINGGPVESKVVLPEPCNSFDENSEYTRDAVLDIYFGKRHVSYEQLHGHAPSEQPSVTQSTSTDAMEYDDKEENKPLPAFLSNFLLLFEKDIPNRTVPIKESRDCFIDTEEEPQFSTNRARFNRAKSRGWKYKQNLYVPELRYSSRNNSGFSSSQHMHQRRGTSKSIRRGGAALHRSSTADRVNNRQLWRGSSCRRNISDKYHYFKSPTRGQPSVTYRANRNAMRGTSFFRRGTFKEIKRTMRPQIQENLVNNQKTYLEKNALQNDAKNLRTVCKDNFLVKQKLQTENLAQKTVQCANARATSEMQVFEKPLPAVPAANTSVPQIDSLLANVVKQERNVEGIGFETNGRIIFPMAAISNAAVETDSAEKRTFSEAVTVDETSKNEEQPMEQECLVQRSFAEECGQIQSAELKPTSEIFTTQMATPSAVVTSSNSASWNNFPVVSVKKEKLEVNNETEQQTKTNIGTSFPAVGLFNVAADDAKSLFNAPSAFVQTTVANSATGWMNFSSENLTKHHEEAEEEQFQAKRALLTFSSVFGKNFETESKMEEQHQQQQQQQPFTKLTTQATELGTEMNFSVPSTDFSSFAKQNESTASVGFVKEEKNVFPVVSLSNHCEQMQPVPFKETVLPVVATPVVAWSDVKTQQEEAKEMDLGERKGTLFSGVHFASMQNCQMQPLQFAPPAISFPTMSTNTYVSFGDFSQNAVKSEVKDNEPQLQNRAFFSFGSYVVDEKKPFLFGSFASQIAETPTSTVANLQSSWIDLTKSFDKEGETLMEAEMIDLTGSDSSQQISETAMPTVVEPVQLLDQPLPVELETSKHASTAAQVEEVLAQPMTETTDSVVLDQGVNAALTKQATCLVNWQTTTDSAEATNSATAKRTNEQTSYPLSTQSTAQTPTIVVPLISLETDNEPLRKQSKIYANFTQQWSSPDYAIAADSRQLDDHHSAAATVLRSDHSLNLSGTYAQDHLLSRSSFDVTSGGSERKSSMQQKILCVQAYRRIRDLFLAKELMQIAIDNLTSRTVDQVVSELCEETIAAVKQMIACRCLVEILNCSYLENAVRKICHQVILEEQKREEISKNSKMKTNQLMRRYFHIWHSITKMSRARYLASLPISDTVGMVPSSRGRRSTLLLSLTDTDEESSCSDDTVIEKKLGNNVLESWRALDWPCLVRKLATGSSGYKVSVNSKTRIRLLRCGLFLDPTLTETMREWIRLQFGLLVVRSKTWTLPPSGGTLDLLCLKNTLIREDASTSVTRHLDWLLVAWNASASLAENHTIEIGELCSATRHLGLLLLVRLAKSDHYSEDDIAKMLKLDDLSSTGCISKYVVIKWPFENVFVGAKEKLQNAIELVIEGTVNFRSLNFQPIGQYVCHYFTERYGSNLWNFLKSATCDEANAVHKDAVADFRSSAKVVDPREHLEEEFLKLLGYPMSYLCSPDDFYKLIDEIGAIILPPSDSDSISFTEAAQYFLSSITDRILMIRKYYRLNSQWLFFCERKKNTEEATRFIDQYVLLQVVILTGECKWLVASC
ncbi:Germinal-center associated nuclear protein, partial [Trichinella pseudospiralis]